MGVGFVVAGCVGDVPLAASITDAVRDAKAAAIGLSTWQGCVCRASFVFNGVTVVVDPFTPVQALADAYRAARDGETIGPHPPRLGAS